MNALLVSLGIATLLLAVGIWLSLPRGGAWGRPTGALFIAAGLGLLAARSLPLGALGADVVFYTLAALTVGSAVGTVTFRNPVYSAIWFAMSLLGTAGLFLFDGAQFLGVATIVVYAGAILVTFLFVLMLAQPRGRAFYDRISWEAFLSSATGAVLVGMLTMIITASTYGNAPRSDLLSRLQPKPAETEEAESGPRAAELESRASQGAAEARQAELATEILAEQHVARFGGQMFGRHLIAVEAAGALLLAALIGAVAIVAHGRQAAEPGGKSLWDGSQEAQRGE